MCARERFICNVLRANTDTAMLRSLGAFYSTFVRVFQQPITKLTGR
jgi:hypothetical protein